jgi:hypothetical protein
MNIVFFISDNVAGENRRRRSLRLALPNGSHQLLCLEFRNFLLWWRIAIRISQNQVPYAAISATDEKETGCGACPNAALRPVCDRRGDLEWL